MKKTRIVIAVVVVFIALVALGLWLGGVFSPKAKGGPGPKAQEATKVQNKVELKPIITSEDLIAKARQAKEIGYETSLLYRTYAVFGDPRLPEKYRSDVIDLDAATLIFAEVQAKRDELSPSLLKELAPFMARPNDPISIFNRPSSVSQGIGLVPALWGNEGAGSEDWISETAVGGKVRIWTRRNSKNAVLTYDGRVETIWPLLNTLIQEPLADKEGDPSSGINPDSAIDIYVLPVGGVDPRREECLINPSKKSCKFIGALGWTIACPPFQIRSSSGYVLIDSSLSGDRLNGTIAHELFHTRQFRYDYKDTSWLMESTATWAEFRVLQMLGGDLSGIHGYLPSFVSTLDESLDTEGTPVSGSSGNRIRQYGAYLFFLFAQMERNDGVVRQIWESARKEDGMKAVDAVFSLKDNFREFALRDWNSEPVEPLYSKADAEYPTGLFPKNSKSIILKKDKKESIDEPLHRLSIRYVYVSVPINEGISKITVNLKDFTSRPGAGVDAILFMEGKTDWEVRHWSGESQVTFCMDKKDERPLDMTLIMSNASETTLNGKIEIDPSSDPCNEWSGTISFIRDVDGRHTENGETTKLAFREQVRMSVDFEKNKETAFDFEMNSIQGSYNLKEYRYSSTFEGCVTEQADYGGAGVVEMVPAGESVSYVPGKAFAQVSLSVDAEGTYQIALTIHLLPPTGGLVILRDLDRDENGNPRCIERERYPVPRYSSENILETMVRAYDYRNPVGCAFIITGKVADGGISGSRLYRGDEAEGTHGSENYKFATGVDTGLRHLEIPSTATVTYNFSRRKKDQN
jgi:hypothetical protein